ncbi:uncharacterized protein Z520_03796 [Fonsecaea multimorphosa CBS 102226]|uniref:Uncharacterized protein n=1 Tax=Fonsecaea multimorphosa CBS 102226 TaxID=1442371 RepID=A0A0D2HDY4_9EURO|nr:uncharacterized protein Z520_03796 [Fonsecaea multimorphosa CBS 102226]KIY00111.1 hypothetical protein Z520_03796 [Fonsecaea multimorphosa CBS 102226]OAL27309.1 hypothetical protein AYO22_03584 [Fonsecaea multimorphosa]
MLNLVLRLVAVAACIFGVALCSWISEEVLRDEPGFGTTMCIDTASQKGDDATMSPKMTTSEPGERLGVVAISSSLARCCHNLNWSKQAGLLLGNFTLACHKTASRFTSVFGKAFARLNRP